MLSADWVEYVIATGGEAHLKTPEHDLSFVVRNSLDVLALVAACTMLAAALVWMSLKRLLSGVLVPLMHRCTSQSVSRSAKLKVK